MLAHAQGIRCLAERLLADEVIAFLEFENFLKSGVFLRGSLDVFDFCAMCGQFLLIAYLPLVLPPE